MTASHHVASGFATDFMTVQAASIALRHAVANRALLVTAHVVILTLLPRQLSADVKLIPETIAAFDQYSETADKQFASRLDGTEAFLWSLSEEATSGALLNGEVVIEPVANAAGLNVRGGLIHDWVAAVFVPGVDVSDVVRVVTDYDSHEITYSFSILRSDIVEGDGSNYHVAMRVMYNALRRVVLEVEHRARYARLDNQRWWGRSRAVRVQEVRNPGKPGESLRPPGHDSGYLWRLHTYWRFGEIDGGVVAEYRTVSLTRAIPSGLGWMLRRLASRNTRTQLRTVMSLTRDKALSR